LISWGKNRQTAIDRLKKGLSETLIFGLPTNNAFCRELLEQSDFLKGNYTTRFLSEHPELRGELKELPALAPLAIALAGAVQYIKDMEELRRRLASGELTSLLHIFRQIPKNGFSYEVEILGKKVKVDLAEEAPNRFRATFVGITLSFEIVERERVNLPFSGSFWGLTCFLADSSVKNLSAYFGEGALSLILEGSLFCFHFRREGEKEITRDPHAAPMAGQIVAIPVRNGEKITIGQELFQIESMKMITVIRSVREGIVSAIGKNVGEPVKAGEWVVQIPITEVVSQRGGEFWKKGDLKSVDGGAVHERPHLDQIRHYLQGYDVDVAMLEKKWGEVSSEKLGEVAMALLEERLHLNELFTEQTHSMAFLMERGGKGESLPQRAISLLQVILPSYGVKGLAELDQKPRVLLHLFQAFEKEREQKEKILTKLLKLCLQKEVSKTLADPLARWLKSHTTMVADDRQDLLELLHQIDPEKYHEVELLPVDPDYWKEYRSFNKNPAEGLDPKEYRRLIDALQEKEVHFAPLTFELFPENIRLSLKHWFQAFEGRSLPLPKKLVKGDSPKNGIHLFELVARSGSVTVPPRFVVVGLVPDAGMEMRREGVLAFPGFERATIEAYRTLRLVQAVSPHQPNHVLIFSTDPDPVPWRTRDGEGGKLVLTPQLARTTAGRVAGFALDVQISATEIVLPLLNDADQKTYWTVIEIRHSKLGGVISRPPFLLHERKPEVPLDREKQMNERQHQMGKLLNRDRAMLLFDNGEYKELFFPEVDDAPVGPVPLEIGLNVYEGKVGGLPTLAYAGDFRFRGGALGEREGKKLASTVVLAYLTGRPLVGFHDGAGANIRDSVASLGWAGSYFGAIAHTGGFSDKKKFRRWFLGHHERDYFEKCLWHFETFMAGGEGRAPGRAEFMSTAGRNLRQDPPSTVEELIDQVSHQLIHFHLHVGATVGMLVYGASVAHASLMVDQPEAYRVLTGAATVARVTGEEGSNYLLGGAKAHAEESGDIEMSFSTEEQVIDQTRRLLKLFHQKNKLNQIRRDPKQARLEVPRQAGIILGRDAIRGHIDDGEFFEVRPQLKQAGGLLTGYASLAGQPVTLVATATDYGISHPKGFKKVTLIAEAAEDLSLPFLLATGDQWQALSRPVPADWLKAREELSFILDRLRVPRLSLALGPRSLEQVVHQRMDLTVYVERGNETDFETDRAKRLCPIIVSSIEEGFDRLAILLQYLPRRPDQLPPHWRHEDPVDRECHFNLPAELNRSYPMRDLIGELFDQKSFLELWAGDHLPLITGFAALGGTIVGLIADDPAVEGGAQNVSSIAKFTRMHRLCQRFGLPLIELNDSPAFRPGREQEHGGIQGEGGKSIREECLSSIPKIAVTLRQNYGGRLVHANLITLGPPRIGLVLEGAKVGVMGSKGAIGVLYGKKLAALPESERKAAELRWQKEYEAEQLNPSKAVELGYVRKPIASKELRKELTRALREFRF
ncbi:MAG: carboxyl transferase domain-containing protein, partial [Deltaproteobacteria bacterium]|nr:carboxyl transferase domain-containing protein [Deltaproteobacteria bacterium]